MALVYHHLSFMEMSINEINRATIHGITIINQNDGNKKEKKQWATYLLVINIFASLGC